MTTDMNPANGTNAPAPTPAPAQPSAAALVHVAQAQQAPHSAARADFELAQRRAKVLSQSTLVPEAYRGMDGLANCMIALNLADRIDADPFAVIQNLDIIHGRPGLRATFLIATVNACGRFTPLRFRFEGAVGSDDWGCRAVAKDRDSGEELVGSLITIAMAKAEGWATKNGSKWRTMPEQMLMYRAASFWTRVYSPELSLGIQTSEEVADITGSPWVETTRGATTSTKALEHALMSGSAVPSATAPAATATPPSTPEVKIEESAAVPASPEAKTPKKAAKAKADAALPTGDLLPATPPAKPSEPERDPYGEPVPPPREPGDDGEELQ